MKIVEIYSHLNGKEYLLVHKKLLYEEMLNVIEAVDAEACKTKESKERNMVGKMLYSPVAMNSAFCVLLRQAGWEESRVSYWITKDEKLIQRAVAVWQLVAAELVCRWQPELWRKRQRQQAPHRRYHGQGQLRQPGVVGQRDRRLQLQSVGQRADRTACRRALLQRAHGQPA